MGAPRAHRGRRKRSRVADRRFVRAFPPRRRPTVRRRTSRRPALTRAKPPIWQRSSRRWRRSRRSSRTTARARWNGRRMRSRSWNACSRRRTSRRGHTRSWCGGLPRPSRAPCAPSTRRPGSAQKVRRQRRARGRLDLGDHRRGRGQDRAACRRRCGRRSPRQLRRQLVLVENIQPPPGVASTSTIRSRQSMTPGRMRGLVADVEVIAEGLRAGRSSQWYDVVVPVGPEVPEADRAGRAARRRARASRSGAIHNTAACRPSARASSRQSNRFSRREGPFDFQDRRRACLACSRSCSPYVTLSRGVAALSDARRRVGVGRDHLARDRRGLADERIRCPCSCPNS